MEREIATLHREFLYDWQWQVHDRTDAGKTKRDNLKDTPTNGTGDDDGDDIYVIHDGPPFANGKLHIGHALNKILKDFVCRYKILRGIRVHFQPGWDCHGLPIEQKALQSQSAGSPSTTTTSTNSPQHNNHNNALDIRKQCRELALSSIELQRASYLRWNILASWRDPYLTLSSSFESSQLAVFWHLYEQGLIFRGIRPVYWSPSSRSALAEAELEYPEEDSYFSNACHVLFPITTNAASSSTSLPLPSDGSDIAEFFSHHHTQLFFLIWTTTPWSLLANQAVAIDKDLTYSILKIHNLTIATATDKTPGQEDISHVILLKSAVDRIFPPVITEATVLSRKAIFRSNCIV